MEMKTILYMTCRYVVRICICTVGIRGLIPGSLPKDSSVSSTRGSAYWLAFAALKSALLGTGGCSKAFSKLSG